MMLYPVAKCQNVPQAIEILTAAGFDSTMMEPSMVNEPNFALLYVRGPANARKAARILKNAGLTPNPIQGFDYKLK